MSALISSLDNYTNRQMGEKGHVEYTWSNCIQEKICQLNFQLTRTDKDTIQNLQKQLKSMLISLKHTVETDTTGKKDFAKSHLSVLYRMIGHTRDIVEGKGEYALSYMMIHTWHDVYPKLAQFALRCFVLFPDESVHPYGSWKDLKYFCDYCKNQGDAKHPLIAFCVNLINKQIFADFNKIKAGDTNISLVAKWAPREKSHFGWLYHDLATSYFQNYLLTCHTEEQLKKATIKCHTKYRQLLSFLNKKIDTLQIKQCEQIWQTIDFNKVTSISLAKQKKAFLNIKKNGNPRYPDNWDRNNCAKNFNTYVENTLKEGKNMKGKRLGLNDFTKQALELIHHNPNKTNTERDILNSQWRDNSTQNESLQNMIARVDVSASMEGDPMHAAIALGIRIAEKSKLGKRVLTFSAKPTWVNLEPYPNFISQVQALKFAEWGQNTNFHSALNMILSAIIQNKLPAEDVENMVLVVLSDMQMDQADRVNPDALYNRIKQDYANAGLQVIGKPYNPPHILFWNLRSTSGFPTLSTQTNTSMMSGFSPVLLNSFVENGLESIQNCTPWSILLSSLEKERYVILKNKLDEIIVL